MRQLKPTACVKYKSRGFWTLHYTMTLWNSTEDMKAFAKSGAHLEAMKKSASIAKEIRTLVLPAEALPTWSEAKSKLLSEGRVIRFNS